MALTLTVVDSEGVSFTHTFSPKYSKHFNVGSTEEITFNPIQDDLDALADKGIENPTALKKYYFSDKTFKFMESLMDRYLNNPEAWKRLASNKNIPRPQSLIFTLSDEENNFLKKFESIGHSNDYGRLKFIYDTGEIFIRALDCQGMAAIIGQYIANAMDATEDVKEMGDLIAYPEELRVYVSKGLNTQEEKNKYMESIPSYDDMIRAMRIYFPDSPILPFYSHISDDPNAPVMGPALPEGVEFTFEMLKAAIQYYQNK